MTVVTNSSVGVGSTSQITVGTLTTGVWNASLIPLAYSGTNANLTAASGGAVYSTASALAITAAGTTGQALVSQGASPPIWGTPSPGNGGGFIWNSISTNTTAVVGNGYIITSSSTTLTLPSTFAVGDCIAVSFGPTGNKVSAAVGDVIGYGGITPNTVASSTVAKAGMILIGIIANDTWATLSSMGSNGNIGLSSS